MGAFFIIKVYFLLKRSRYSNIFTNSIHAEGDEGLRTHR